MRILSLVCLCGELVTMHAIHTASVSTPEQSFVLICINELNGLALIQLIQTNNWVLCVRFCHCVPVPDVG